MVHVSNTTEDAQRTVDDKKRVNLRFLNILKMTTGYLFLFIKKCEKSLKNINIALVNLK